MDFHVHFLLFLFSTLSGCEVSATLTLDNREVDQTKWNAPSNRAWEQQFKIDLDKVGLLKHARHTMADTGQWPLLAAAVVMFVLCK